MPSRYTIDHAFPAMISSRALRSAAITGTILQLVMVFSGHFVPAIAELFAVIGMSISLVAGLIYAKRAGPAAMTHHGDGGLVAGGLCALIGIAVSCLLGDVTTLILVVGTLSSAVTGAIGGVLGHFTFRGSTKRTTMA